MHSYQVIILPHVWPRVAKFFLSCSFSRIRLGVQQKEDRDAYDDPHHRATHTFKCVRGPADTTTLLAITTTCRVMSDLYVRGSKQTASISLLPMREHTCRWDCHVISGWQLGIRLSLSYIWSGLFYVQVPSRNLSSVSGGKKIMSSRYRRQPLIFIVTWCVHT